MLICLDVGNTHIVVGIYESEEKVSTYRISTNPNMTADELGIKILDIIRYNNIQANDFDFIVSSVVPKIEIIIKSMVNKYFKKDAIFVGQGIKSGIKIRLDNPKELGADILVGAVAACNLYGPNVVVIDMGTAMTLVYVNEKYELMGGTIIPGIRTAFSSLFENAAKLEDVPFEKPKTVIGKDTKTSIQSGMFYGYVSMIEGLIKKYHDEIGEFKVVLTGGESQLLKELFKDKDKYIFDNELLVKGLRILYNKNKK